MDVRTIKRAAKMSMWRERILACRSSGIPVKTWCKENDISYKTYYRWERLYLAEAGSHTEATESLPAGAGQLVRVDPDQLPEHLLEHMPNQSPDQLSNKVPDRAAADMSVAPVQAASNAGITLRYGAVSVEMPAGMDISQVAKLMKALGQA